MKLIIHFRMGVPHKMAFFSPLTLLLLNRQHRLVCSLGTPLQHQGWQQLETQSRGVEVPTEPSLSGTAAISAPSPQPLARSLGTAHLPTHCPPASAHTSGLGTPPPATPGSKISRGTIPSQPCGDLSARGMVLSQP